MPKAKEIIIPEGVTFDEEKMAREIDTDPILKQYSERIAKLEARKINRSANHHAYLKTLKQQHYLEFEAMYVELRVLRTRATLRKRWMRKVAIKEAIEDAKNKQDAKAAAEFKRDLMKELEAPAQP